FDPITRQKGRGPFYNQLLSFGTMRALIPFQESFCCCHYQSEGVSCPSLSKRKVFEGRRGVEWIAAERFESASQNSFLIPTSQKVAEPRVSSGAEVKKFAPR